MPPVSKRLSLGRPSHAGVVAYAALFVSLGGVGYAATQLPAGSVGSRQLKNGAVTLTKIASPARAALHGAAGPAGATGAQGKAGPTGPPGPATGAAGGALSGSYPDPTIAHGAVSTAALASGSVTSTALGTGAVTPASIGTIPAARVTLSSNNGFTANQFIDVPFDTVSFDDDGLYDSTHKTLRAPIAGIYQIDGGVEWAQDATGTRFAAISAGSCCQAASWVATSPSSPTDQSVSDLLRLTAGEDVYLVAEENSTTLYVDGNNATYLAMHWVSP